MYKQTVCQRKHLLILLLVPCFLLFYSRRDYVSPPNDIDTRPNKTMKTILYWTPMFHRPDFYLGLGQESFQSCSTTNCFATSNRNLLPIEEFDAIMFHGVEYHERRFGKPAKRDARQIYIFFSQESPINSGSFLYDYNDFYNWTMTYRLDSDLVHQYGTVEKLDTNYTPPTPAETISKKGKIAWLVSNCRTNSKREYVYNKLKKYIQIDVFGACGDLSCSKSFDCYGQLERNYKFYLSFENSLCEDYVTEKLYKILDKNIVPIVYSGADLQKFAPPHSVINVMDFNSTEELANYLIHLDTHIEDYLKFFEWKKHYIVHTQNAEIVCDLCRKLNEPPETKIYTDLAEWWIGTNPKKCTNAAAFYPRSTVFVLLIKFLLT